MILRSYGWLGLRVTTPDPGAPLTAGPGTGTGDYLHCQRDLTWNRALIDAAGGEAVRYKLAAFTQFLTEQGLACIQLALDLEDPGTPALAAAAEDLGFFYSGLFPESGPGGHDMLELQFLNGITIDPDQIRLYQESGRAIMSYIKTLPGVPFQAEEVSGGDNKGVVRG